MPVSNVMPESASRLERKRTRNRDALVAAARGLFARDGFQAATIADIAEAADLGFGTFYRYFADKEAVLEAIFEDGREELDAVLHAAEPAGTPAPLALARLSRRFVHLVRRDHDLLDLMWQVAMRKPVGGRPLNITAEEPGAVVAGSDGGGDPSHRRCGDGVRASSRRAMRSCFRGSSPARTCTC